MPHSTSHPSYVIILLGPPGCGKGTQAERLVKEHALPHISTGNLFRENMNLGTPIGVEARKYIEAGQLVPNEVVLAMLFNRISEGDCQKGFMLDGFPRTIEQADILDKVLPKSQHKLVLYFNVPDETIVLRAGGRLLCRDCGAIYHQQFSPPKVEGVCDLCGGEVYRRTDDAPDVIRQRLKIYHEQTQPLHDYYKTRGLLRELDGTQSPDAVFNEIQRLIGKKV
jgi:adenylate kinase